MSEISQKAETKIDCLFEIVRRNSQFVKGFTKEKYQEKSKETNKEAWKASER